MRPDEIKPGRTYEGADGDRRTVEFQREARFIDGRPADYQVTGVLGETLLWETVTFAAWAVREVSDAT